MAKQKKRRNFLKTWAAAVTAGAFLVGSGVFLGLEASLRHGAVAQNDIALEQQELLVTDQLESREEPSQYETGSQEVRKEMVSSEIEAPVEGIENADSAIMNETISDSDSRAGSIDEGFDSDSASQAPAQPSVGDTPENEESAKPVKRRPRAPAPSPSAAVRLATGEEVIVPANGRIDRYMASRDNGANDPYTVKNGVGPEYYQPRPTD